MDAIELKNIWGDSAGKCRRSVEIAHYESAGLGLCLAAVEGGELLVFLRSRNGLLGGCRRMVGNPKEMCEGYISKDWLQDLMDTQK